MITETREREEKWDQEEDKVKNPSSKYWKGGSFKCSDSFNKYAGPDLNRKGFSALIP